MLMATVYFTDRGVSLAAIGLSSLLGLPWTIKFLWSPLMDLIGNRRTWVLSSMVLLFVFISVAALFTGQSLGTVVFSGVGQIPLEVLAVAGVLLLISLCSATADIAEDAFYMDALDERQQAAYVGSRVTAYRVAMLTASGLLVYIAGKSSWQFAFFLAALLMGIMLVANVIVLPRPARARPRFDNVGAFLKDFSRAFTSYLDREKPVTLLLFILTYKLGEQMLGRMSVPFLMNECDISTKLMGIISGGFGVGATIVGALAASYWIVKRGLWFGLISITIAMNGTDLLYVWLASTDFRPIEVITAVHVVESFSGGAGSAAFAYLLIRTCAQEFRASHYAIATGLMSLGGTISSSASGFVAQSIGYAPYFILCTLLSLPGILLLFLLPKKLTGRQKI